jgi:putative transposase
MDATDNELLETQYYGCCVVDFYHEERPHQGLGNQFIAPKATSVGGGPVRRRDRLGGVLKFYYRAAA